VSVGSLSPDARPLRGVLDVGRARTRGDPATATIAIAIVSLTALAAILRFTHLAHQGFWFDEANTAADLRYSPGQMLGLLPQNETTPPLFYCVAWVWARVFGFGEFALRSLPALAGVATVPIMYGAGAKLVSRRAGVVAAALTAFNPFLVWYSQEFRPYAPMVLLSAAGLLAFAYALEEPTTRAVSAWAILSALGLANHYYALLVVVPEAVWLLLAHRRTRSVPIAIALVGACGAALLPLAISQNSTGNASWISPIPLVPRLGQIVPQFLIGFQAPSARLLERVAEACVLLALILLAVRCDRLERRGALVAGVIAFSGFVLNLVLVAGGIDDLITRNVLSLWPPAAIVVAAGLGARRARLLGGAAAVALCVTGVIAVAGVALHRSFQRPDWRAVGRVLGSEPAGSVGDRAILVQDYRDLLPLSLYLHGLHWLKGPSARVTELDVVSIKAPRVALCWWGAACNLTGSTMQRTYAIPGFHVVWRRRALQFTVLHMVSSKPVRLTPAEVARALTTTTYRHDELLTQGRT
jgi:4-amino-4-deoxy-L-arabinose transferase-like glycosyltransferase